MSTRQREVPTPTAAPTALLKHASPRDYGVLFVFVALFIALSIASPTFFSGGNLANLLDQASVWGIVSCGVTLTIVSGIFDLSIGSIYAVAAIVAVFVGSSAGAPAGFVAAVAAGAGMGVLNGLAVTLGRINSFIATLATAFIFGGLAIVITGGKIVTTTNLAFRVMNESPFADITAASWLFIGIAVATGLLLAATGYGRALYAIGGNREAARLSGLRITLNHVAVLALSGACAGAAGIIDASRTGSAQASMGGVSLTITAIAATVIGGTSIMGGEGAIWRAVIGVFILVLIGNGFNLLGISAIYQEVVQGALILLAVILDQVFRRRE
ncbi:MAG: ABC transporter permease [Streptosporangiaceae bacterium]